MSPAADREGGELRHWVLAVGVGGLLLAVAVSGSLPSVAELAASESSSSNAALSREALRTLGPCPAHRRSWAPIRALLES